MTELCLLLTAGSLGWELTPKPRAHLSGHSIAEGTKAERGRDEALAIVPHLRLDWHDLSPRAIDKELISHRPWPELSNRG